MSARITRSCVVVTGAALIALAVMSGCSSKTEPKAAALTTSAPPASATPSESAAPSQTSAPAEKAASAKAAPASAAITKAGTTLKFGEVANVQVGFAGSKSNWIGGLKVIELEKAPASDYKDLGVRDDAGSVYYLRYDVTYLAGKTKYPPTGDGVSWVSLHPQLTSGQDVSLINKPSFKKCTTIPYKVGGGIEKTENLAIGDTATNMCTPFLVAKGKVSQVVHTFYDAAKNENLTITWK